MRNSCTKRQICILFNTPGKFFFKEESIVNNFKWRLFRKKNTCSNAVFLESFDSKEMTFKRMNLSTYMVLHTWGGGGLASIHEFTFSIKTDYIKFSLSFETENRHIHESIPQRLSKKPTIHERNELLFLRIV